MNRLQGRENSSESTSEKVQLEKEKSNFLPITLMGMIWVVVFWSGVFFTIMTLVVSLAFWVVTKNPIYIASALLGACLFLIWGYKNLKKQDLSEES
ncbi:MAG: hypothetical protein ACFFB2_02685 [Promethearchaeota archaeon]